MKCTSCDTNLDLSNHGFAVRPDCMHTVCSDCSRLPICGACFKAQQIQQKKLKQQNQLQQPPQIRPNIQPLMHPKSPLLQGMGGQQPPVPPPRPESKKQPETSQQPKPQQKEEKKQAEKKEDTNLRKIKVGNLPYTTTAEQLSTMFSLCGRIEQSQVFPYVDFKNKEQNYGLVTFSEEESAKLARLHHEKVFKGHVITVVCNKHATFSIFVSNFPAENDENQVKSFFEAYGVVKSVNKVQESKFFVNFAEDHVRRNVMSSNISVPSKVGLITLKLSLKEPPNKSGIIGAKPEGDEFSLLLEDVLSRLASKARLEEMFELFGLLTFKQVKFVKETSMSTWKFCFATSALRDQALQFNNRRPNKWDVNLQMSVPGEKKTQESANPAKANKRGLGKSTSSSTINVNKKTLPPSSSKETIPPQKPSKKEKATSQPTLNKPKFAVKVTGFDKNVKGQDLESYFSDAGTIVKCEVIIPKNGNPFAEITYATEDDMNKAIGWSTCLFGYPSQTLIINRLT